jgi:stage II sporulation protein AA (anti-sigma F factor antagonist)
MNEERVFVSGEIDMDTAPDLALVLDESINNGNAHILVDCERLTFIDSCGVRVLLDAYRRLREQRRHMLLVNVAPGPRRVFELLGLADLLHFDHTASL